jgi:predicted enzyme related to lactoylglutathione lyase
MSGIWFQRGNHMVADLDRALAFYEAVPGFDVTYILPPDPDSYSYDDNLVVIYKILEITS